MKILMQLLLGLANQHVPPILMAEWAPTQLTLARVGPTHRLQFGQPPLRAWVKSTAAPKRDPTAVVNTAACCAAILGCGGRGHVGNQSYCRRSDTHDGLA